MRSIIVMMMLVGAGLVVQAQDPTDGFTRYFHPNGQVSSEGMLVDGKPEGYWRTYYDTGVLRSEGNRAGFLLDSLWRFYDPEGRLQSETNYRADKKEGEARRFDADGNLMSLEIYENDLREGVSLYYHANGQVHKEIPFVQGKEEGRGLEYAEDGRIVALLHYGAGMLRKREDINRVDRMGMRQGPWKEFHPNGKVKWEVNYVDDRRQGIFKEYDGLGNLKDMQKYDAGEVDTEAQEKLTVDIKRTFHPGGKVASIGSYSKSGKREGLFKEFAPSGEVTAARIYMNDELISEGMVNDLGAMEGPWTEYFVTGEKRAEGSYKAGRREGDWTFYHRSGKVEQKGKYLNGLPHGEWRWYHENGNLHREEIYRRGREDGPSVEYAVDGKVITKGEYIDGLREGKWLYELGDHREEGHYKDGLRDGQWVFTYEDGRRNFVGQYVAGERHGKHRWWWPNGQLRLEGRFTMGLEQGDHVHYNEFGYAVLTVKYRDGVAVRIDGDRVPPPVRSPREQP
jgi:antitoxin component YwqK of YwqJK toxin-antitoxin module